MPPKLPPIGVRTTVENVTQSLLDLDKFNARIEQSGKKAKEAAAKVSPLNKAFGELDKQVQGASQRMLSAVPGGNALSNVLSGVNTSALVAAAGVAAAAAAAVAAFAALGARGAPLIGLARSFDNLAASVNLSSKTLLEDMRKASAGTISDFGLIERANLALVGSTGAFGEAIGKSLPKLLEIARTSAKATGQDIDFLYQSIVTGIKRGSPLILDNLGLVISVGDANKAYAESIGKTVDQLTEQEKKVALLNATLAAGQGLIDAVGTGQETAAEKIARANASISNTFDRLAIAIQPAYEAVLDVINDIVGGIEGFVTRNAGLISGIAQVVGQVIRSVGTAIKDLGKGLLQGGYNTFKAFAQGIVAAANGLIFPAVIAITKAIADVMVGFSPPKVGPLSKIDKGGENVMLAWLGGLTGVSLDPIEKVTAEVSELLGDIGKANLALVERRLAELDKALIPFQNRLEIVKSRFDAIAAPAKAALEAIDRQLAEAETALAAGDQAAAERIRLLDAQRAAIQGNLDAQQSIVDQASVQLALAQAQQAQERALLNIRKAQLQVTTKVGAAVDKATGKLPKEAKEKKGKAGETPAEALGIGGTTFTPPTESVLDDLQFDPQAALDLASDIFGGTEGLQQFGLNQQALETQINRIRGADIGKSLQNKLQGLTSIFDPSNPDSIIGKITGFVSTLTGDSETEGSIAHFFAQIPVRLDAIKADLLARITAVAESIFDPETEGSPANIITSLVKSVTGDGATSGLVADYFAGLPDQIEAVAGGILTRVTDALKGIFDPDTPGSAAEAIVSKIQELTGDANTPGSIANFFSTLPQKISDAASGLLDKVKTDIFDPVGDFLTGSEPGTLGGIINSVVTFFSELPARITSALQTLGASLNAAIVVPVINVINSMIAGVESGLKALLNNSLSLAQTFIDLLGGLAPPELSNAVTGLRGIIDKFTIPRIAVPVIEAPAAATGGLFSKGLVKVGERGPEYIGAASKIGVLPAEITRALDGLGSILAAPAPMMIPVGNTYNNSNSSVINATFNGQQDAAGVMRRLSLLQTRR